MKGRRPHLRAHRLARLIEPRVGWDDVALDDRTREALRQFVSAGKRARSLLLVGGEGRARAAAVEALAARMQLSLLKADLDAVVSKYIGETEKNLDKLFGAAESSETILFFDEADALFGKRSSVRDAHDRYAQLDTSDLLARVERYSGLTVFGTRRQVEADAPGHAFAGLFRHRIEMPCSEGD